MSTPNSDHLKIIRDNLIKEIKQTIKANSELLNSVKKIKDGPLSDFFKNEMPIIDGMTATLTDLETLVEKLTSANDTDFLRISKEYFENLLKSQKKLVL